MAVVEVFDKCPHHQLLSLHWQRKSEITWSCREQLDMSFYTKNPPNLSINTLLYFLYRESWVMAGLIHFKWSLTYSQPVVSCPTRRNFTTKWQRNIAQQCANKPTRCFHISWIWWTSSSGWLQPIFLFGTENRKGPKYRAPKFEFRKKSSAQKSLFLQAKQLT